jgi:hypothetical protein
MRIIWNNVWDTHEITANSEASGYPAANLQDISCEVVTRSTGDTSEWWKIGDGVTKIKMSSFAIINHNFTSGATVTLQGNDTDSWGAPSKEEVITYNADIMTKFFTEGEYYYWRLLVADASNPDEYIEIGRLAGGEYLQMPPIEPGLTYPKITTSTREFTVTGQVYGDKGRIHRTPGFAFPIIEDDERVDIDEMFDGVHNIKPVVLIVYENSLDVLPALYCVIDQEELPWQKAEDRLAWSLSLKFREVF